MKNCEMVELYRGYVFNRDACITPECISSECLKNHENLYRVIFETNGVTLQQLEHAASQRSKTIAETLFDAMFETESDKLAFCLKCEPSNPVWVQNGNDMLFGMLEINGCRTNADMPMHIVVMDEQVRLTWGSNNVPSRDREYGPAIVDIKADKSFVGHHFQGGAKVAGLRNWRKRCSQRNLWMAHL